MMLALVLSVSLMACQDSGLRGDAAAAASCFRQIINTSADSAEIAGAYAGLGNYAAASDWYRKALNTDADDLAARLGWARLFASVHQRGDAETLFREVLERDPDNFAAQLGLARLYARSFDTAAGTLVETLLDRRPESPGPLLLKAEMQIELGQHEAASGLLQRLLAQADLALADRLDALALRASIAELNGAADNPWLDTIMEINPDNGQVYATAAYFYIITRRYREAVALLEQAVSRDPELWQAHSDLGLNLLRVNRLADARRHLETAYRGDPYNPVTVNTLRLLDTLEGFEAVAGERLIVRAEADEARALVPFVQSMAARAAAEMAPRYDYQFTRPMIVELYQHHDDFAVRTAGLPGIGILGATFGDVVVMDGPGAKSIYEGFDWSSALWHEMAHVVTLNATDNLVARWFSEGISVFEEWRFGPAMRTSLPLNFLEAWQDGRLLPVADLDEGFIRPTYEGQVMVSYVQSGLICQLISEQYPGGLSRMLKVYRDGGDSQAAIRRGLAVEPAQLDESLRHYLQQHWGAVGAGLEAFAELQDAAQAALQEEDWAQSLEQARLAVQLYPGYVEPGSPYVTAVRAAAELGDSEQQLRLSRAYFAAGGRHPAVLSELAGKTTGEEQLAVLNAQALALPLQIGLREQLARALLDADQPAAAAEQYRAVLSLEPHDRAAAHYQLATALNATGNRADARQQVLLALEIAPRYPEALSLLVELQQ